MSARHFVVLTGAGVSADSGVATFRDAGGLWEGHDVEDVATPEGWARDPALVWRFYQLRRRALRDVEPNAGHLALATLEREVVAAGGTFLLITQNVDDLHERAGSQHLLHMHGELRRLRCTLCDHEFEDLEQLDLETFVPCPECSERARPAIVWFGELPLGLDQIESALRTATDFLAVGTSGEVWPAAGFLAAARAWGARTTVMARERPRNLAAGDHFLEGRSVDTLPAWVREWREASRSLGSGGEPRTP
ncbi:MAG: NAD-dependent deacylase [Planctomycetota bacterium]